MESHDKLKSDYLAFKPYNYLKEVHEVGKAEAIKFGKGFGLDIIRAQKLIDQLPQIEESLPSIIKDAIWKLQILSALAIMYNRHTMDDALSIEKISAYAIKAKLADYSLWGKDDIDVVNEKLDIYWVIIMAENDDLAAFERYAKTLRDKISLKEEAKAQVREYKDWDAHVDACRRFNLDPYKTSERMVEIREQMSDILNEMGVDNDRD